MGSASSTGEPADVRAASDRRRIGSETSTAGSTSRQASVADSVPPPQMDGRNQADNLPSAPSGIKPQDPKERIPAERSKWVRPALNCAGLITVSLVLVLAARWLYALPGVQDFLAAYPGHASMPASAPEGLPAWLGWQHFFNIFFMVLIVRTGLQVRLERRPAGYWTPKKNSLFSPRGNTPKKVALSQWMHQVLDVLWVLNGAVFIILLFVTGQWMRIVPTSWDIFPNMLSAGLQYASLNWPTENGWINYNALQVMAYFLTVFIGAPLAIVSGVRISTWWPEKAGNLTKKYPVEWARAIHFPVMIYFVAFTGVHVFLVFFTGALRNLNHMYTSRDAVDAWGLVIFLASLLVIAAAWFLTRPVFTTPIASQMGKVSR
jgi:thiosulfate reductase cytochrome b subunit